MIDGINNILKDQFSLDWIALLSCAKFLTVNLNKYFDSVEIKGLFNVELNPVTFHIIKQITDVLGFELVNDANSSMNDVYFIGCEKLEV